MNVQIIMTLKVPFAGLFPDPIAIGFFEGLGGLPKLVLKPRTDITFQVPGIIGNYFIAVFKLIGTDKCCPG